MYTYIVRCLESSADLAIYGLMGYWAKNGSGMDWMEWMPSSKGPLQTAVIIRVPAVLISMNRKKAL